MTADSNRRFNRSEAPLGALQRFARSAPPRATLEHCDLCNEVVPSEHRHLLDLANRSLLCACRACALLFDKDGAGSGKYLLIPQRILALPDFQMSDGEWEELMIPVNMAFLYRSAGEKPVAAFYPGPAGATESMLDLAQWNVLVDNNPILETMAQDVEALLINRVRGAREYYIVPIDSCYQLVGLIRISWRGLSGGEEVLKKILAFFSELQARAKMPETSIAGRGATDA